MVYAKHDRRVYGRYRPYRTWVETELATVAESRPNEPSIVIRVELFGRARMLCERGSVEVEIPAHAATGAIAAALAASCPELVGEAIREDRSGLRESYTFNLNGTSFMSDGPTTLRAGDSVLLFSSQAGG